MSFGATAGQGTTGAAIAIAIGVWWNANTVSHIFIHRPFFRRRAANACVAALLTAALGFPQALWRDRHLAHHRGARYRFRLTREIALQFAQVAMIWLVMALAASEFFALVYLPGYVMGLMLCAIHGHYEHAGGTTSHYGRLYNALCFNDGYHVEHHRHPSAAWWRLPRYRDAASRASAWPAPLRWLEPAATPNLRPLPNLRPTPNLRPLAGDGGWPGDGAFLATLERLVLRLPCLQRWVVRTHARALAKLLSGEPPPRDVTIVGGGLFPRTAIVLRRLLPQARLTIVDANRANLECARAFIDDDRVAFVHARFPHGGATSDLLVVPLAFDGDRTRLYERPPASTVIVHDWLWRVRGASRIVSPLLLKRVNLVRGCPP
jgi:fatty acid desaturase